MDGLEELIARLASALGETLRLSARVDAVRDMGVRGFRLHMSEGAPLDVAVVVVAAPAAVASTLVAEMDPEMSRAMAEIPSASVTVVHLGFDEADLGGAPDGFGFLVPRGEGPRILGTLWASSIFPGRASEGKVLLTVMIGGTHDPAALDLADDHLLDLVRIDLAAAMGLRAKERFVRIFRHRRGIPQYTLGHAERLATIERRLAEHPGLFACGNSYRGISVNHCVEQAPGTPGGSRARAALNQSNLSPSRISRAARRALSPAAAP